MKEFKGSGPVALREVQKYLSDSKTFLVEFEPNLPEKAKEIWFRHVKDVYKEMGGKELLVDQDPDNSDKYLVRPYDDPDNNY